MKIIIYFLFCAIIVIDNSMGTLKKVDSYQLEGKIVNGKLADGCNYRHMASLQLNGHHVCSSALFQKGFLLTAGECSRYIAQRIQRGKQRNTAVLGNRDLRAGQRINVLKLAYINRHDWIRDDIGLVMLADDVDYTRLQVINLYQDRFDLRIHEKDASVCGWGTDRIDDEKNRLIGNAEYSENLRCLPLHIGSRLYCEKMMRYGNFRKKLSCAKVKIPGGEVTLGDTGSPVCKVIKRDGTLMHYAIGIVLPADLNKTKSHLRIIRTSAVLRDIKKMMEVLQSSKEGRIECSSSGDEDSTNESNKRSQI